MQLIVHHEPDERIASNGNFLVAQVSVPDGPWLITANGTVKSLKPGPDPLHAAVMLKARDNPSQFNSALLTLPAFGSSCSFCVQVGVHLPVPDIALLELITLPTRCSILQVVVTVLPVESVRVVIGHDDVPGPGGSPG
jgi:hypothetical protein